MQNKTQLFYGLMIVILLVAPMGYIGLKGNEATAAAAADDDKTKLHGEMEIIDEATKKLRRLLRKDDAESKAEALEWIDKMAAASAASKAMIPQLAAKQPEAQRDVFTSKYRRDMAHFLSQVYQMEVLVLDGKMEEANDLYKQLKVLEDEGHEKYMEQDE